jgi:uncharacterized protein YutE (UPF0331/DUF86 family)
MTNFELNLTKFESIKIDYSSLLERFRFLNSINYELDKLTLYNSNSYNSEYIYEYINNFHYDSTSDIVSNNRNSFLSNISSINQLDLDNLDKLKKAVSDEDLSDPLEQGRALRQ